ncbi:MAG: glycoside hydrolase family 3 C-terminal domain-containing protein, partial [Deltaproteobacteria bacterium]|nr:glycoside hydrolase family 3 C-terminal domain-containing protein [Deltaproteobacteria bacterium]
LGAAGDADLMERIGRATAIEARGAGINLNFAPQISVIRNIKWGRSYEGFGETPEINSEMGAAYVHGLQGMGDLKDEASMAATAKHYVGDGGTKNGQNLGTSEFSEDVLRAIHLPPFEAVLDENVAAIMPSYHDWVRDGVTYEMTSDKHSLTDILVGDLGFDGIRVSDYDAIARLSGGEERYTQDKVTTSVEAGIDMAMIAMNVTATGGSDGIGDFMSAAASVDSSRLDDAVRRILRIKVRMDLFSDNFKKAFSNAALRSQTWSSEHQELAREAVQKSLVVVKNDGSLPLEKSEAVHVAGPFADNMGAQAGGWTLDWQGSANYNNSQLKGETIVAGMQSVGSNVSYDASNPGGGSGDKVVVVIGEYPYAEGFGDHGTRMTFDPNNTTAPVASVNLADQPNYNVLTSALSSGKKVILVILSGRPLIMDQSVIDGCDAIVAAWLPGSRGIGVADVLFGDVSPSGKLTHTWPKTLDQEPVNVDIQPGEEGNDADSTDILYPYGHGLSY